MNSGQIETKDLTGQIVRVRIPKFNITPVIVIPWSGKDDIEVSRSGKKINFAQMVLSQGGIVIYTREFERYVQAKTSKKIDFKRLCSTTSFSPNHLMEGARFAHLPSSHHSFNISSRARSMESTSFS